MAQLIRYTFAVRDSDRAPDDPWREKWVRKCDSDAQAEAFARRISRSKHGAWVEIRRADATWGLRAHDIEA